MNRKLENKTALITGAALEGGQGAAEAQLLAENGALVILADVQDEAGEERAQAIRDAGGDAHYRHLDVADEGNWASVIEAIRDEFGALHILVNNAGVTLRGGNVLNTSLEDWNRVLSVNLTGPSWASARQPP